MEWYELLQHSRSIEFHSMALLSFLEVNESVRTARWNPDGTIYPMILASHLAMVAHVTKPR